MAMRGCDGYHHYCQPHPVCTALGQTQPGEQRKLQPEAGMAGTLPTVVILAGLFCLQGLPLPHPL